MYPLNYVKLIKLPNMVMTLKYVLYVVIERTFNEDSHGTIFKYRYLLHFLSF